MGNSEKMRFTSKPMVETTGLIASRAGYFTISRVSGSPRARAAMTDSLPNSSDIRGRQRTVCNWLGNGRPAQYQRRNP